MHCRPVEYVATKSQVQIIRTPWEGISSIHHKVWLNFQRILIWDLLDFHLIFYSPQNSSLFIPGCNRVPLQILWPIEHRRCLWCAYPKQESTLKMLACIRSQNQPCFQGNKHEGLHKHTYKMHVLRWHALEVRYAPASPSTTFWMGGESITRAGSRIILQTNHNNIQGGSKTRDPREPSQFAHCQCWCAPYKPSVPSIYLW